MSCSQEEFLKDHCGENSLFFLQGAWVHGAVGTVGTVLIRREAAKLFGVLFHCFSTAKAVGTSKLVVPTLL